MRGKIKRHREGGSIPAYCRQLLGQPEPCWRILLRQLLRPQNCLLRNPSGHLLQTFFAPANFMIVTHPLAVPTLLVATASVPASCPLRGRRTRASVYIFLPSETWTSPTGSLSSPSHCPIALAVPGPRLPSPFPKCPCKKVLALLLQKKM